MSSIYDRIDFEWEKICAENNLRVEDVSKRSEKGRPGHILFSVMRKTAFEQIAARFSFALTKRQMMEYLNLPKSVIKG